jgi:uncharacterized membrane protein
MRSLRAACGPFFVLSGLLHFVIPKTYKQIVPPYLPAPDALVFLSGVAEVAGGLGLMVPASRKWAGRWLIATLVAIFPANLHMAQHPERYRKVPGGAAALRARLPLQAAFIAWVLVASGARRPVSEQAAER